MDRESRRVLRAVVPIAVRRPIDYGPLEQTIERPRPTRAKVADLPLHPFLFASLFVVYLLAANLDDQVRLPPFIFITGHGDLLVCWALVRNLRLAAVLATLAVLWVFLYEFVSDFVTGDGDGDWLLIRYWALIGLAALAIVLVVRKHARLMTRILNFVAGILLLYNLLPVVPHQVATAMAPTYVAPGLETLGDTRAGDAGDRRDIYYIILDRYPSQETLMSTAYGYDNSPFLDALEQSGFYVAEHSRANYIMTALSIASSLKPGKW